MNILLGISQTIYNRITKRKLFNSINTMEDGQLLGGTMGTRQLNDDDLDYDVKTDITRVTEKEQALLTKLMVNEKKINEEINELELKVNSNYGQITSEIKTLNNEMKQNIENVKQDIENVKQDIENVKQDMENVKQDMENVKQDMENVKQDMDKLRGEMKDMKKIMDNANIERRVVMIGMGVLLGLLIYKQMDK
eukprot:259966_1